MTDTQPIDPIPEVPVPPAEIVSDPEPERVREDAETGSATNES